ncbi:hypothetical protein Tco_0325089 [Tanacetum coccineum]
MGCLFNTITPRSPSTKAGITEFAAALPSSSPPPEKVVSLCLANPNYGTIIDYTFEMNEYAEQLKENCR